VLKYLGKVLISVDISVFIEFLQFVTITIPLQKLKAAYNKVLRICMAYSYIFLA